MSTCGRYYGTIVDYDATTMLHSLDYDVDGTVEESSSPHKRVEIILTGWHAGR